MGRNRGKSGYHWHWAIYLAPVDPCRLPATIARDFDVEDDNTKETRARRLSEGAAKVDAYWQRVRAEEVARMIDFLQTRLTSLARAMKEGAAEVDAYWQRVREGGKDCHAASSECSASTLAHAVIHEERVGSESRRSARIAARSAAVEPRKSARIAARSAAVELRKSARIATWSVAIDSSSPRCSSRRVPRVNVGSHPRQSARM